MSFFSDLTSAIKKKKEQQSIDPVQAFRSRISQVSDQQSGVNVQQKSPMAYFRSSINTEANKQALNPKQPEESFMSRLRTGLATKSAGLKEDIKFGINNPMSVIKQIPKTVETFTTGISPEERSALSQQVKQTGDWKLQSEAGKKLSASTFNAVSTAIGGGEANVLKRIITSNTEKAATKIAADLGFDSSKETIKRIVGAKTEQEAKGIIKTIEQSKTGLNAESLKGIVPEASKTPLLDGSRIVGRNQNDFLGQLDQTLANQKRSEVGLSPQKIGQPEIPSTPSLEMNKNVPYGHNTTSEQKILQPQLMLEGREKQLALPGASKNYLPNGENAINLPSESKFLNPETAKQEVQAGLQTKFDNFEKGIYGSATNDLKGGDKGASKMFGFIPYQDLTRGLKEKGNVKVAEGLSSENKLIRGISKGIRGLMGSAGNSAERTAVQGKMRGGIDSAQNLANDFQKLGETMLPDKLSREKVWAHLDPELSGVKVDASHLTAEEQKAVEILRSASDLINDQNFAMGKISHETWMQGRGGKYITRAYEEYDLPVELSDAFSGGKGKQDLGAYKQRTDITDWKQENAIKDPFYLASKRIQSTFSNKAISDYGSWAVNQPGAVSDVARAGYTQLSENPMWGALSGKNVRQDVLEGIKGFYSDNKVLQGLFDGLNAYDKNPVRQVLKKTKTVYNPATRLGNQISNRVFALFNGINPVSFEKNMQAFAKEELKNNGQYARMLRDRGVLGTDMSKYELVKNLAGKEEMGKLGKIDEAISTSYGAADDKAKVSAFKYWLDKGKTVDEAIIKVQNGFQDYSRVGKFYDAGAKMPLIGKTFVRFQSELVRIIKNSATENPLSLATVVGSIALIGNYASKLSGETPEDKKTREGRFGTPVIPFTNIPLVFQTPYGEVNVARMFGMYETAGADTTNKNLVQRASKYLPIDIPTNKDEVVKMISNDVTTGGLTSLITDSDFRGKSIADPNQNKYQPSTLTSSEQNINRAKYLFQNYNLPVINDAISVKDAAQGEPNFYGQTKTPSQAISKMVGFKVEQFGAKQASDQRIKDQQFAQYSQDDIKKNINAILKDQQAGKIDQETAQERIANQQKLLEKSGQQVVPSDGDNRIVENPSGGFSYTDSNGDFKTVKTKEIAELNVAKNDLLDSDKEVAVSNNYLLIKNDFGEVQTIKNNTPIDQEDADQLLKMKKDGLTLNTTTIEAYKLYKEVQDMPSSEANPLMKELKMSHPKEYKTLYEIRDYEQFGFDSTQFEGLSKTKGEMAYAIVGFLKTLPEEKSQEAFKRLKEKGYITKNVLKQMYQIRNGGE